jgi:hypothetical protein
MCSLFILRLLSNNSSKFFLVFYCYGEIREVYFGLSYYVGLSIGITYFRHNFTQVVTSISSVIVVVFLATDAGKVAHGVNEKKLYRFF